MRMIIRWALILIGITVSQPAFSESISLSLPELPWSLEIAAPGFVVEEKEIAPSGEAARFQAVSKASGMVLSAFLEKAVKNGDSKACREYYWNRAKQSPFKKEQISMRESGSLAVVEYMVPDYLGKELSQKNLNVYLAEGDYWMDVHISKTGYKAGDEDPLQPILKGIRINRTYVPAASDRFDFGNIYYRQKNYKKAATQYENALELEKQKTSLPRNIWIVLVDQLGMSYGISGDLAKSKQLYEWAVTKEPECPMFYYNLACTFAEMNNLQKTIDNLRLAYRYKQNSLPGESIPNPRTDSSFARYLDNPEFKAALEKIDKGPNHQSQATQPKPEGDGKPAPAWTEIGRCPELTDAQKSKLKQIQDDNRVMGIRAMNIFVQRNTITAVVVGKMSSEESRSLMNDIKTIVGSDYTVAVMVK